MVEVAKGKLCWEVGFRYHPANRFRMAKTCEQYVRRFLQLVPCY